MKHYQPQRRAQKEPSAHGPRGLAPENRIGGNGSSEGDRPSPVLSATARSRRAKAGLWGEGREFHIIVIGASAGGVEALSRLVQSLPPSLPAAVFVVLHVSSTGTSMLPQILQRAGGLPTHHACDGMEIRPGQIYIAPPDHHLLIKPGRMVVARGPRENNARPAVDPLFRTAALSYGPWVIGVILSGGLDDGTLGLLEVKRYGGIAVVQDPNEALIPSMPASAVEHVPVDSVLPLKQIGPELVRLAREPVSIEAGAKFMTRDHWAEGPDVAEVGNDDLKTGNLTGPPSKFTCPECGGALWELENGKLLRYRCHIGHGYTAETLMVSQGERLENALWSALRVLEETAEMRRRMAERARKGGWTVMAPHYDEQAEFAEARAALVRSVLVGDEPQEITSESASAVEIEAGKAKDLNAGEVARRQPGAKNPPGRAKPPDPKTAASALQSKSDEPSGKMTGNSRKRARQRVRISGTADKGPP
jgi:two-component system chemotaxis response regulator CheB